MTAIQLKLFLARMQIEAELSQNEQFGSFSVQSNVAIKVTGDREEESVQSERLINNKEIADLVVDKQDGPEIYLIRPFYCSEGELYGLLMAQMERILQNYKTAYGSDGIPGREAFLRFSPCDIAPSELLIYWCAGDGIIYFQFVQKTDYLNFLKQIVSNLNFLYIQYLRNGKYT